MIAARLKLTPMSSRRWEPRPLAFGEAAIRRMPRITWWCWVVVCAITLLNGNSIAILAGGSDQLFSLPLLGLCGVILWTLRDECVYIKFSPAIWTYVFALGFLSASLLSEFTSRYGNLDLVFGPGGVLRYFATLLLMTASMFVATRAISAGRFDALLKLLFWLCTATAISGYVLPAIPGIDNYLTFRLDDVAITGRLQGVFGNVNELGLQSGYPIVLGLVLSLRLRNMHWLVMGVSAGAMGVLASGSKAAMIMLSLLIMQIVWEGWKARSKSPLIGWIVALIGVGAIFGAALLLNGIVQRTASFNLNVEQQGRFEQLHRLLTTLAVDDETTSGRSRLGMHGINISLTSPVIGCGLGTFNEMPETEGENCHNSFLLVFGESGIVGLSLFGAMLLALLTSLWRCRQKDVRVLGVGFMLAQLPLWMSSGQAMTERGHNLITGSVLGMLVMALLPGSRQQEGGALTTGGK